MSKTDSWENSVLLLLFNNTNVANVGDATGLRGSTAAGSLYVSLHTADPGETGTQSTNETAYTGYARVAVARTSGGWTVTGNSVSNTAAILFGTCTAAPATVTHFGVGVSSTGATALLYKGAFSSPASLAVNVGVAPNIPAGSLTITED